MDMRKKFSMMRVGRHWSRFPSELVDAPSVEIFKVRLDGVAGVLEAVEMYLLHYRSPEQSNFLGTATQPAASPALGLCTLLCSRPVLHVHAEPRLSSPCNVKSVPQH